jgi:hypothetical protein
MPAERLRWIWWLQSESWVARLRESGETQLYCTWVYDCNKSNCQCNTRLRSLNAWQYYLLRNVFCSRLNTVLQEHIGLCWNQAILSVHYNNNKTIIKMKKKMKKKGIYLICFLSYLYLYFSGYYHSLWNKLLVTQKLRLEGLSTRVQLINLNNKPVLLVLIISHRPPQIRVLQLWNHTWKFQEQ